MSCNGRKVWHISIRFRMYQCILLKFHMMLPSGVWQNASFLIEDVPHVNALCWFCCHLPSYMECSREVTLPVWHTLISYSPRQPISHLAAVLVTLHKFPSKVVPLVPPRFTKVMAPNVGVWGVWKHYIFGIYIFHIYFVSLSLYKSSLRTPQNPLDKFQFRDTSTLDGVDV